MEHEVNGDWDQDWLAEHTVGTGPFYAAEWIHGMRLVLKRNDNYWGKPAKLAQVELRYVPEPEDLRMLLEKGEIDIAEKLAVDQIQALKGVPGIRVFEGPSFSCHYIYLNCQRPYLNDVRVRRAISYAIDYEGIVDYIWQGTAVRMEGPVPIGFAEHIPVYQYPYDPDRAKALLKEAGYEKGFTLRIMHSPVVPEWRQMAIVVQQNLADIGVKVEVESYARVTRGQVLSIREIDFVAAARAAGASSTRIMLRHILPNCIFPVVVQATLDLGEVVLTAATLSFIGFGAQPPTPGWGAMVSVGRNFLRDYWWYTTFPGLAILITVMGFNLLGDAVRDILDPRLRRGP